MRYMLLIYGDEKNWTKEEHRACVRESQQICEELAAQGKYLDASPLLPVATAATLRVRDGVPLITDGPFAETTEQLGGYYLLDLADLDEAITVASRLPPAKKGTVEIRPVFPMEGVPPVRTRPSDSPGAPFMLISYDTEATWQKAGPEVMKKAMAEAAALTHRLDAVGQFLNAAPLHPSTTATCVRIRNDHRTITDGPFAETNEVLGGFYLLNVESRETALRVARQHIEAQRIALQDSSAKLSSVEVRQLFDVTKM